MFRLIIRRTVHLVVSLCLMATAQVAAVASDSDIQNVIAEEYARTVTEQRGLSIEYPYDAAVFPPEISSPMFRWNDENPASDTWLVSFEFYDGGGPMTFLSRETKWMPGDADWEEIKRRSTERPVEVAVIGVDSVSPRTILSSDTISFRTSEDEVGAPIFYRDVNLPFVEAVKDPSRIKWRFGSVAVNEQPPAVLENLPVCGNCHSFSADGTILGMDVDYGNNKGSYVTTRVAKQMVLSTSEILTWNDFRKEDGEPTLGLLSQVSPDGRYIVSTVKDKSVFTPRPDFTFSQLFFPIKGILAVYDRETERFFALPGADDSQYVQSNPSWSPDGKYIVFARNTVYQMKSKPDPASVFLSEDETIEFFDVNDTFLFDLYRIPFNDGKGGIAEPVPGASHNGMSNYFARYSPDGKWLVFCKAKSYMLLQPDSELYIMPAEGGEPRRMRCNTARMNSWHSWSPNSKWLVFASKVNTPYTQLFLTHIDEDGNSTPPVLLEHFTAPDRAANIPEFVNTTPDAIARIEEQFVDDYSYLRAARESAKFGDLDKAVSSYEKALALNPASAPSRLELGLMLARQKRFADASEHLAVAAELKPRNPVAHSLLGYTLLETGRLVEAEKHLRTSLSLKPKHLNTLDLLARACAEQGDFDEAVQLVQEAHDLAVDAGKRELAGQIKKRMDLYKQGIAPGTAVNQQ